MSVNINPGNFSALASMAGNQVGNLGLEIPGQMGLKRQALLAGAFENMASQGMKMQQMNMAQQQNQAELALKQQQVGMAQQAQNQSAGLDREKFEFEKHLAEKKSFMEQQKQDFKMLLAQDKQKIENMGKIASYGRLAIEEAKTPEDARAIQTETINQGLKEGYLSKEEAEQLGKLPISGFKNALDFQIIKLGKVNSINQLRKTMESKKEESGESSIPSLGEVKSSKSGKESKSGSGLSVKTRGQAEADLMTAEDNIKQLNKLYKEVPDDYFGVKALKYKAMQGKELIGGAQDPEGALKKYSEFEATSKYMTMNIIKQLSGLSYTDKQLEYMASVLPQTGLTATKSEFEGRAAGVQKIFNEVKSSRQELLKKGFNLDSPEYKEAMQQTVSKALGIKPEESSQGSDKLDATRQYYKSQGWSDEQIDGALRSKGYMK